MKSKQFPVYAHKQASIKMKTSRLKMTQIFCAESLFGTVFMIMNAMSCLLSCGYEFIPN